MAAEAQPDPWLYFVHGTTASTWAAATEISGDRGGGELGAGFYTFEDSSWGRQAAASWARRKVASAGDEPVLVRVKIRRSVFLALDRQDVGEDEIEAAYNSLYQTGRTGRELVVGPVSRRGADGRRVADKSLPRQYKFEGTATTKLTFDSVISAR